MLLFSKVQKPSYGSWPSSSCEVVWSLKFILLLRDTVSAWLSSVQLAAYRQLNGMYVPRLPCLHILHLASRKRLAYSVPRQLQCVRVLTFSRELLFDFLLTKVNCLTSRYFLNILFSLSLSLELANKVRKLCHTCHFMFNRRCYVNKAMSLAKPIKMNK